MVMGEEDFFTIRSPIQIDMNGVGITMLEGFHRKVLRLQSATGTDQITSTTTECSQPQRMDIESPSLICHLCSRVIPSLFDCRNDYIQRRDSVSVVLTHILF